MKSALLKLLAIADVTKDPYAVIDTATSLLHAEPEDPLAAYHFFRAAVALGLTGIARRLPHPALAEQIAHIPAQPTGQIPWTSRARRYKANMTLLQKNHPAVARYVETAYPQLDRYELFQSGDGNLHIRDTQCAHLHEGWLQGITDHRALEKCWHFDAAQTPLPHPVAFDGLGFGWLIQHVASSTANSFLSYSCPLYILEPDPLAFTILLHLHDLQSLLASPRLRIYVDPSPDDLMKRFQNDIRTNSHWSPPQQWITDILRPRQPLPIQSACETLIQERASLLRSRCKSVEDYYSTKDLAFWRSRFQSALEQKTSLTIVGITSRYTTVLQHSMRELQAAFQEMGHTFITAIEPDDHSTENPFVELLHTHKPDLIVQISRLRYENPFLPSNVPYLSWDQDNLPCMRTPHATASLTPLTYVAGHGAFHGYVHLKWPRQNCIFCHLAGAAHRYQPRELTPDEYAAYSADLSYVSNASSSPESLRNSILPLFAEPAAQKAYAHLTDGLLKNDSSHFNWNSPLGYNSLGEYEKKNGITFPEALRNELVVQTSIVADRIFRHRILSWIADAADARGWKFKLYGKGWQQHPRFSSYAAGPAQQGAEINTIYLASKINLQIIETGFLHSRSLDGIAAGGFFLTPRGIYDDTPNAYAARMLLASHIRNGTIRSVSDMLNSSDSSIRNAWEITRTGFEPAGNANLFTSDTILRVIDAYADMSSASTLPHFDEITFTDRESLLEKATHFLGDDAHRRQVASEMRTGMIQQFSYDSRARQFLQAIAQGLSRYALGEAKSA